MTDARLREIIREELAFFFSHLSPEKSRFDADINILAADGPEALKRICRERVRGKRHEKRI